MRLCSKCHRTTQYRMSRAGADLAGEDAVLVSHHRLSKNGSQTATPVLPAYLRARLGLRQAAHLKYAQSEGRSFHTKWKNDLRSSASAGMPE